MADWDCNFNFFRDFYPVQACFKGSGEVIITGSCDLWKTMYFLSARFYDFSKTLVKTHFQEKKFSPKLGIRRRKRHQFNSH